MKFSIVVPTYNRAELVQKCIGNNIAGIDRNDIELVWVDDCSTDNVRDVMKAFKPDISILKKKNEGVFKAYNSGYAKATGDWIVKMGSDILFPDNWLTIIKEYIERIPATEGIGILIEGFFDGGDMTWADGVTKLNGKDVRIARDFMGVHAISRRLFEEVGYFDEDFGWYGPGDWDWSDRAKNTGKLLYYLPLIRAQHLGVGEWNYEEDRKGEGIHSGDKKLAWKREYTPNRTFYTPFMSDEYQKRYLQHQRDKATELTTTEKLPREPYPESEKRLFLKVIKNRRSQRIFTDKEIFTEEIKTLFEAIRLAPSSCNRQAIYIKVLDEIDDLLVGGSGWINGANKIFLIFADMEAYKSPNEVDFMPYLDAGVVVENLYLTAEALGISCCFVNPNIRKNNIDKFNNKYNKEGNRFCGAMAFGYSDNVFTPSIKNTINIKL